MPNWCMNDMTFHADNREDLDKLLSIITDESEKHLATFGRLKDDYDPKREDWYDWNIQNIGTKWEPTDMDVYGPEIDSKAYGHRKWRLSLCFCSAWSPPLAIMPAIAAKFPKMKFRINYSEDGMSYRGHQWWNNGKMTKDYYGDL